MTKKSNEEVTREWELVQRVEVNIAECGRRDEITKRCHSGLAIP